MPNPTQVRVTTMEYVDPSASNDKFYRVYMASSEDFALCQNGSQRGGRQGGTYRAWTADEGATKIREKLRKGYVEVSRESYTFEVDFEKIDRQANDRLKGVLLENVFNSARGMATRTPGTPRTPTANQPTVPSAPPVSPPSASTDQIEDLTGELLAAINLAATDPDNALVAYAEVGERLKEVKENWEKVLSYKDTLDTLIEDSL